MEQRELSVSRAWLLVVVLLAGAIAAAFGAPGFNVTLLNAFWFIAVAVLMTVRAVRGREPA